MGRLTLNVLLSFAQFEREVSGERVSQKGTKYGGEYFSRGALYGLLQNPAYIGKTSHKGEIHEGLHDAIVPLELWDAVQKKLSEQSPISRGHQMQRHKNLLTGLIFDEAGNPYSPVFTNKKGKKYRYYFNQVLSDDPDHPNKLIARLPAHEIETLIEKSVREKIPGLCGETHGTIMAHVEKYQHEIPIYELIRKCVERITVQFDQLVIRLKPDGFVKLVDKHLSVSVTGCNEGLEVTVPYQTRRAQNGAIILNPADKTDIFDLSPKALKKLIQGVIWRDEHFDGMAIKAIARREKCSHDYVSSAILKSFKTLQNAA